jgi:hypothetical protein
MATPRFTIPRTIWAKLQTKANKPEYKALAQHMRNTKVSTGERGATVLWEPPKEFIHLAHQALTREITFARKKESVGHLLLLQTVAQLSRYSEQNFGAPPPTAPAPTATPTAPG